MGQSYVCDDKAMGWTDGEVYVRFARGTKSFFSPKGPDRFSPFFFPLFRGYRWAVPGAKRLGLETDYSVPYGVEFRNGWSCTSTYSCYLYMDNTLTFHKIFLINSKVLMLAGT
jgi:hypothetical protein